MTSRIAVSTLIGVSVLGCHAQVVDPVPMLDRSQVVPRVDTLSGYYPGDTFGILVFRVQAGRDTLLNSITLFSHDSVLQQTVMAFDPQSLRLIRVQSSNRWEAVDLTYSGNRVGGTRITWNAANTPDTLNLDVPVDGATMDRRTLLTLVQWLPLASRPVFTVRVFDSWTRRVLPVRIAVRNLQRVTVPAGGFRTYPVELTTSAVSLDYFGLFPTIVYVSADSPRAIVRIDRPREKTVFQLISRLPS